MSECPSHCCTVRRSTPAQRHRVANVAPNLCSQKSSGFCSARSATAFRSSRKFIFTLHAAVGKTKLNFIEEVHLHVARGSRKDQVARLIRLRLQYLEAGHQLCRNRNFSLFVRLWRPAPV